MFCADFPAHFWQKQWSEMDKLQDIMEQIEFE
jgi:hypothetical protein